MDAGAREQLLDELAALNLFSNTNRAMSSTPEQPSQLSGDVRVAGRTARIRVELDPTFPGELPRFYLEPWDSLGFIPHITQQGFICFVQTEGTVLNRHDPAAMLRESLDRVLRLLDDGVTRRNAADFVEEFNWYWLQQNGVVAPLSTVTPGPDVDLITMFTGNEGPRWLANSSADIGSFLNRHDTQLDWPSQQGLYVPLEPGTTLVPPRPDGRFWTALQFRRALLPNISRLNSARLKRLLGSQHCPRSFVVVMVPRPSGGEVLFGVSFDQPSKRHPLSEGGDARKLIPMYLQRLDSAHLLPRGGAATSLQTKTVLIVGCGSVGGHLAMTIARSGVLNLTLVDSEKLDPENTFRHVLGQRYGGRSKAEALREELELQLPYVRARSVPKRIEEAIADGDVNWADFDLVAFALGRPTTELLINEQLWRLETRPLSLNCWVEPLGIGGHAIASGTDRARGCLECLYTDTEGDAFVANRASFAAPGQSFGRDTAGCGTLYTPYGSIDAQRTAILAATLAVDALTGKATQNPLRSWRGDSELFEAAGFRLSARFAATDAQLAGHQYEYVNPHCRVCGRGGDLD